MRKALVIILLLLICTTTEIVFRGCAETHIDLREPIYLVIEESFWSGCEYDPENEEACRASRIKEITDGANEWFKHFNDAAQPKIVIVYSEADLPFLPENEPIHVKIQNNTCGFNLVKTRTTLACYQEKYWSRPVITFYLPDDISAAIFAHELGHAFGRGHIDTSKDVYSIMSYTHDSGHVTPTDIKILCEMHPECPPHEDTWCQGGFWDKDRCPSSSYEEGERNFKTKHHNLYK